MTASTKINLRFNNTEQFKESFSEANTPTIAYISIGNHIPYVNESSPDSIVDTIQTEKSIWDKMYAAKKVTGNDVELVIPRINWTANTNYRQYDDTIDFGSLLSANVSQNLKPMYVITSGLNVYKCVSNNASANSTVEPTGNYTTSNGNIGTADSYIWKYMYNVSPSNKYLTTSWIPAPTSTTALDYGVDVSGVVDGELSAITVTNNGVNYRQASNIVVNGFTSGQSTIKLANTTLTLQIFSIPVLSNLSNLSISGTGIPTNAYISSIANATGIITLSSSTTASGGNANNITISTRVYIDGDGVGAVAGAAISNTSNGVSSVDANISKISVTTIGSDYSYANVYVYGSGSAAVARAILPPKFGHAFNPAKELNANNVMISVRIGEIDSTEQGLISIGTSFRQTSLFRDPYKYNTTTVANTSTANSVISQTTNIDIVAGTQYTLNEYVYQGNVSNPTAYGYINDQTTNGVRLTQVKGVFETGLLLVGATSGSSRTITAIVNPEFEPYSGDILYIENSTKVDRADGQAENIKLVVSF
jgi:hypothetical protein